MVSCASSSVLQLIISKSPPPLSGSVPSSMRSAFTAIEPSSACLCSASSLIFGIESQDKRSLRISPEPTDGSWSGSPTSIIEVPLSTASRRCLKSIVSTIDISSMTITLQTIGLSFPCTNRRLLYCPALSSGRSSSSSVLIVLLTPRSLWIVEASVPLASDSFFAALPVGAAKTQLILFLLKYSPRTPIIVVLPVPGPPVITLIGLYMQRYRASSWDLSGMIPRSDATSLIILSLSSLGGGLVLVFSISLMRLSIASSDAK